MLVHSAPRTLLRDHGKHPNLGVLASPRCVYGEDITEWPWAADNDAYSDWSEDRYRRMLDRICGRPGCLFVTSPDVVGDALATRDLFEHWYDDLVAAWQPLALVAQDGLNPEDVPWARIDALFIGGTSQFKLGEGAAALCRQAKNRGKWLHMGRVNTRRRFVYAKALACDSVDGTSFSMYRKTHLPWALEYAAAPQQLTMSGGTL